MTETIIEDCYRLQLMCLSWALKKEAATIWAETWQSDFVSQQHEATCCKRGENLLGKD